MVDNVIQFTITARDNATRALNSATSAMVDFGKASLKVAAAAAAAGAATAKFTESMAGLVVETELMANTAGLTVDEFTKMAHAAGQFGVSSEQLSDQLKDVNDKVGDFLTAGAGPMVDFFEQIAPKVGVTAEQFRNLSSKDAMQLYVSSLEKANLSQAEMTFFMEAIASDATKLIPLFSQQGKAMREAANDAEFLGITMSSQLVHTSNLTKNALDRSMKSVKGLGLSLGEELMPALIAGSNAFTNFVANNRERMAAFLKTSIDVFFGSANAVREFFKIIEESWSGGAALNMITESFNSMRESIGEAMDATATMIIEVFSRAFSGAGEVVSAFADWAFNSIKSIFTDDPSAGFSETVGTAVTEAMALVNEAVTTGSSEINQNLIEVAETAGAHIDSLKDRFTSAYETGIEKSNEFREAVLESSEEIAEVNEAMTNNSVENLSMLGSSWKAFYSGLETQNKQFTTSLTKLMNTTVDGFSKAFASAIVGGKSLSKSLKNFSKEVLNEMVSMLVKIGIQRLLTGKIIEAQTIKEGLLSFGKIAAEAFGNVYSSISAIPIVGPFLAPAAAIAAFGLVGSKLASISGIAHGGLENVPNEGTFLLDKGERVLSPRQNTDLTSFLSASNGSEFGGGGGISVENLNVEVMPNATSADAFLAMDRNELKEVVAGPIIDAFNELDNEGVRPNFIERAAI